jgi:hypothetical protein
MCVSFPFLIAMSYCAHLLSACCAEENGALYSEAEPRLLVKREIAKSMPESLPRPRARRDFFFLIHVRSSKSKRHFKFRTNSVSVSRSRSSLITIEANTHPAHQPTPQKFLVWCVPRVPCTHSRTCVDHMVTLVRGEVTLPPIPSPPSSPHPPPPFPPPLPPPPHLFDISHILRVAEGAIFQGAFFSQ